MLFAADIAGYQVQFEDVLAKYGLIENNTSTKKVVKERAKKVLERLANDPPTLKQGAIFYPGGESYFKMMEAFPGNVDKETW